MRARPRGSVVEQLIRNEQIVGSIPTEGSIHPGKAQVTGAFKELRSSKCGNFLALPYVM